MGLEGKQHTQDKGDHPTCTSTGPVVCLAQRRPVTGLEGKHAVTRSCQQALLLPVMQELPGSPRMPGAGHSYPRAPSTGRWTWAVGRGWSWELGSLWGRQVSKAWSRASGRPGSPATWGPVSSEDQACPVAHPLHTSTSAAPQPPWSRGPGWRALERLPAVPTQDTWHTHLFQLLERNKLGRLRSPKSMALGWWPGQGGSA